MTDKQYHHGDLKNALIKAGIEILSTEGIDALSLRKVASRAGVSHSAPYAHFADKEALIAAISTEGFYQLYETLERAARAHEDTPVTTLCDVAIAYVRFAQETPARFKIMFSGVLKQENEYPEFVKIVRQNFSLLSDIVTRCQATGLLRPGPQEVLAVSVWSLVHGFTSLLLERQISHHLLDAYPLDILICQVLNQVTLRELSIPLLSGVGLCCEKNFHRKVRKEREGNQKIHH